MNCCSLWYNSKGLAPPPVTGHFLFFINFFLFTTNPFEIASTAVCLMTPHGSFAPLKNMHVSTDRTDLQKQPIAWTPPPKNSTTTIREAKNPFYKKVHNSSAFFATRTFSAFLVSLISKRSCREGFIFIMYFSTVVGRGRMETILIRCQFLFPGEGVKLPQSGYYRLLPAVLLITTAYYYCSTSTTAVVLLLLQ